MLHEFFININVEPMIDSHGGGCYNNIYSKHNCLTRTHHNLAFLDCSRISSPATLRWWTSSGPSAIRSVRTPDHIRARRPSTPAPPCACGSKGTCNGYQCQFYNTTNNTRRHVSLTHFRFNQQWVYVQCLQRCMV